MKTVNKEGKADKFKTRCIKCGSDLIYSRRDIRIGSRYPDGCIVCRSCGNPVSHSESNLIKLDSNYSDQTHNYLADQYSSVIKTLRILHHIFLPLGLVLMLILSPLLAIYGATNKANIELIMPLSVGLFLLGLGFFITARIFTVKIRNRGG